MEAVSQDHAVWPLYVMGSLIAMPFLCEIIFVATQIQEPSSAQEADDSSSLRTQKGHLQAGAEALKRPAIAWPTLMLGAAAMSGWSASIYLFCTGAIGSWMAYSISTVCTYYLNPPTHDATHHAASPKYRWLNESFGHICIIPYLFPFALVRWVHMQHHQNVDEHSIAATGLPCDPDEWAGRGPVVLLPLRWCTRSMWYIYWTKKNYKVQKAEALRKGDTKALAQLHDLRNSSLSHWALSLVALVGLWCCRDIAPIVCWIAPAFTAAGMMIYVADYLPHRPHLISQKMDR
eukprot:TRINITY_DN6670_c0_g1_i5.p1 TRINITY_DN6670_c0_g1~~TRINITY_DN6670_c0_g1_i5.p1  ORF type:complete len:290 (-),score=41.24 TRINITY_DN6670_c0_g1_i5:837-1706(-)